LRNGTSGQDENHLSTSSQHGTMATRANSVPGGITNQNREWGYFHSSWYWHRAQ